MTNEHRPDVFTINDVMYYFADDIKSYFPKIFSFTGSEGLYGINLGQRSEGARCDF